MKIYIDADSCPQQVRNVIIKAGIKKNVHVVLVANRKIPVPGHAMIHMIEVGAEEGAADHYIIDDIEENDLLVTRDIPLAEAALLHGAVVINDRGDRFSSDTIRERISIRNIMADFRSMGLYDSPNKTFSNRELQAFANCFDREFHALLQLEQNSGN